MQINNSHLILDACCVLNFCASGKFSSIIKSIPAQVVIMQIVKEQELLTIKSLNKEGRSGAEQLELAIEQNLIKIVDFESEEEAETYINYAFELGDDGESATGALALHREWAIATDDKKAISLFRKEIPHIQIVSTPEIIKYWSEQELLEASALRDILLAIRVNGRYEPPKNHPLLSWWKNSSSDV